MDGVSVNVQASNVQTGSMPGYETQRRPSTPTGGDQVSLMPMNDNMIEFRIGGVYQRFPMSEIETANEIIPALLKKKLKSYTQSEATPQKTTEDEEKP